MTTCCPGNTSYTQLSRMVLTATFMPSSSANSRARQIIGSSPAWRRPPGSSHSLSTFSRRTTRPTSSRTPLIETGKDIAITARVAGAFFAEHKTRWAKSVSTDISGSRGRQTAWSGFWAYSVRLVEVEASSPQSLPCGSRKRLKRASGRDPPSEASFPINDCVFATRWAAEPILEINADTSRIVVAGDSAGGTLTAVTSFRLRDKGAEFIREGHPGDFG